MGKYVKNGYASKIDPKTTKGKNIYALIAHMGKRGDPSTEISAVIKQQYGIDITATHINNIRRDLDIPRTPSTRSLDKSHPEVVAEIRRLTNQDKIPPLYEIRAAIKEKFGYITTDKAIKRWSGVDFSLSERGTRGVPLSQEKIDEIKRLTSENKLTQKQIAETLDVSAESVRKHTAIIDRWYHSTPEQLAEEYPDLAKGLLSSDKDEIVKARAVIYRRLKSASDAEARKALIASYEFEPLSDEAIDQLADKKAIDTIHSQKQRALLYKIAPEPVPESYISYEEYARLKRRGVAVPPILGRAYRGIFTPESTEAMRKKVYDYVHAYLKGGGNPNFIDKELGHIIAMAGVDELGVRYSGLTVPPNVEMQDVRLNRSQHNKVTQDLLKRLGYHTGKSLMSLKGLPFGIGLLATTGASMLPSQSAEASTVRGRMRENLTNPNWLWSMATMLPEDFWSGVAESKERFSGSSYKEDFARAAEQRRQLREGILNIPERARNLYGQVRSIFD